MKATVQKNYKVQWTVTKKRRDSLHCRLLIVLNVKPKCREHLSLICYLTHLTQAFLFVSFLILYMWSVCQTDSHRHISIEGSKSESPEQATISDFPHSFPVNWARFAKSAELLAKSLLWDYSDVLPSRSVSPLERTKRDHIVSKLFTS